MATFIRYETVTGNNLVEGYQTGPSQPIPPPGAQFAFVTEPTDYELLVADVSLNGTLYVNDRNRWRYNDTQNRVIQRNDTSFIINVDIVDKRPRTDNPTLITFEYRDKDDVLDATFQGKRFITLTNNYTGKSLLYRLNFTNGVTSRNTVYESGEYQFIRWADPDDGAKKYRLQGEVEFIVFEEVEG